MKIILCITSFAAAIIICEAAIAQSSTQIVAPGATVTTTVASPDGTTTTKVTTTGGQSALAKLKDGTRMEIDSDGSVYQVFADGARVTATDGVHTLIDGTNITVKDGKRIP